MPGFKDFLDKAADVFINTDDFADLHIVNGVEMPVVLDEDLLKQRQLKTVDPNSRIHQANLLVHLKKSNYGDKPDIDDAVDFDGEIYRVAEVAEDCGIYTIALAANRL